MGVETYTVKTLSSTIYVNNKLGWISNPPNPLPFSFFLFPLFLSLPSLSVSAFFYIYLWRKGDTKHNGKK
jgi:hypothetical protein